MLRLLLPWSSVYPTLYVNLKKSVYYSDLLHPHSLHGPQHPLMLRGFSSSHLFLPFIMVLEANGKSGLCAPE